MTSAEFVQFESLAPGTLVDVETRNRHYRIECLGGRAIRISGHPDYCPTPVAGELQGPADKGAVLEPGMIERGRYLRFLLGDGRPITTSRVLSVHVQRSALSGSDSNISVQ
jgi:hypothetical protein